ncbi:nicotinamide-nucleotide amidase [Palleronia aestuarii]|uniref:Nicotinamide-nucleotide amidase n=1 Tax=Palleronia aestuarii TaxID=568105 RepID=A0A2W7NKF2_9RHOB|nr:CinA family protein [Palleronia aestuarii]PZX19943.1 nicotinamide-nucleotide amidase [Palleronia aestuarii]
MSAAERLLALARARGAILATAESCTAGMVAGAITDPPGASAIFDRGFVTYSNAAKETLLGVPPDLLRRFGAVSEEVAQAMAMGALARSDATLAVAVTGIAGPGGSETKPEGRVCFALAPKDGVARSETVEFGAAGRGAVRAASVARAIELLLDALEGDGPDNRANP